MGGNTCNNIFFNKAFMANYKQFYRSEHKQRENDWVAFHNAGSSIQLPDIKGGFKMAQVKMIWLICDIFGIPLTILGIFANIDNIKSVILAILAIAYLMGTGYYRFKRLAKEDEARSLDLWHKEMDKQERLKKINGDKKE